MPGGMGPGGPGGGRGPGGPGGGMGGRPGGGFGGGRPPMGGGMQPPPPRRGGFYGRRGCGCLPGCMMSVLGGIGVIAAVIAAIIMIF